MQNLSEQISRDGNRAIFKLNGNLTAASAPAQRELLKSLIAEGVRELEINLAGVYVVDSTGIGLLVAAHNSLERLNGKLSVTMVSNELVELFTSLRLDRHFSITSADSVQTGN
jgi:anti-anti-sigma factor